MNLRDIILHADFLHWRMQGEQPNVALRNAIETADMLTPADTLREQLADALAVLDIIAPRPWVLRPFGGSDSTTDLVVADVTGRCTCGDASPWPLDILRRLNSLSAHLRAPAPTVADLELVLRAIDTTTDHARPWTIEQLGSWLTAEQEAALAKRGWSDGDLLAVVNSLPRPASTVTVSGPAAEALSFKLTAQPSAPTKPEVGALVERHDGTVQRFNGETWETLVPERMALYSTRQAIANAGLPVTLSAAEAVRQIAAQRDENAAKYLALLADFDKLRERSRNSEHTLAQTLDSVQREREAIAATVAASKEPKQMPQRIYDALTHVWPQDYAARIADVGNALAARGLALDYEVFSNRAGRFDLCLLEHNSRVQLRPNGEAVVTGELLGDVKADIEHLLMQQGWKVR